MAEKRPLDLEIFQRNYADVSAEVAGIAADHGHSTPQVVVVSKYLEAHDTRRLIEAGVAPLGENRAPELEAKQRPEDGDAWHFIGHLQRNKASKVVSRVSCIHSVDSLRLAEALESALANVGRSITGLVQVNVSGEASKGGLTPDEAKSSIPEWESRFQHLRIAGLMTMAPIGEAEASRPFFRALRELRDEIRADLSHPEAFCDLSMGMSNDFRIAAQEGATLLRLGSILYRAR